MAEYLPESIGPMIDGLFVDFVGADHPRHERLPLQHIDAQEGADNIGLRTVASYLRPNEIQLPDEVFGPASPAEQVDKTLGKSVKNKILDGLLEGIVNYGSGRVLDDVDEVLSAPWNGESYSQYKPL